MAGKGGLLLVVAVLLLGVCGRLVGGNSDAKRLYDDMMSNYNRLIRPVHNHSEKVMVKLGVRLTQIIEIVSWQTIHERCSITTALFPFATGPEGSNSQDKPLDGAREWLVSIISE